ncbi:MAG: glycosyltransferase family 39 protein [Flavobacteriales bacterium]|nr:glycosyltransferase family 39 protein [Flavobacteriales bacterium]
MARSIDRLRRLPWGLWFLLGFVLLCCAYEYGRVLPMRPLPHHLWRQTTCLSITQEYAETGGRLLAPAVQSYIADDASSGRSTAEFPIIYYVVGALWKLIGQSEFAYRLLMLLLHAAGSWALFALTARVLKDGALAVLVALFFFTVPTVVYFTLAFLPDVPALDLVLLGALALARYLAAGGIRNGAAMVFCFAMGGLLKITALMVPIALFLTFSAMLVVPAWGAKTPLPPHRVRITLGVLAVVFLVTCAWTWYAIEYNRWNSASYSVMGTWAYWEIGAVDRVNALRFGREILIYQLFDGPIWWALAGMLFVLIRHVRIIPAPFVLFNAFLLGGTLLYVLLWTIALNNHDYYFIAPLVLPIAVVLTFFLMAQQRWLGWLHRAGERRRSCS